MKKLFFYYLAILIPLPYMFYLIITKNKLMIGFLFAYVIYRGYIDGQRLIEKSLIKNNEIWKAFIPFWCSRFYRQLYFEK
jgi:hypothetical protein